MAAVRESLLRFNSGEVSTLALARTDLERMPFSAEEQVNWVPRALGSMMLRPGLEYIGNVHSHSEPTVILPFIRSTVASGRALLELSDSILRIWLSDLPLTRGSVATTVTNGDFSSATGWTLTATPSSGATATISGGTLNMAATARGSSAFCTREVTVAVGDQGDEHALRIVVNRGPVLFRCGSTSGNDDYISETTLATGTHSLAFTPTGNFWPRFIQRERNDTDIGSIQVEGSGVVTLPTPWVEADLPLVRHAQSADVLFLACDGHRQRRIERRAERSWSVVEYHTNDGPFSDFRTASVRLKPSVTEGDGTLTADAAFFKPEHEGALFRLFHQGLGATYQLAREDTYTEPMRVTGVNREAGQNDRFWSYTITGTWSGTLRWSRSFADKDSGYTGFRKDTASSTIAITANASLDNQDDEDNSIVFYRIGFQPSEYTSGTATITVNYGGHSGYGICRVNSYVSSTVVNVAVLKPFIDNDYTENWREGEWSALRGFPSAVGFHEGRLFWAGRDKIWGSVSDAFDSFDPDFEGDAGPINRSLGSGPIDVINWVLPIQRLLIGTEGAEVSMRSSSFDEPLTPTNVTVKDASTQGSARLAPAKVDQAGIFVQRAGKRVYELRWSSETNDYAPRDLTLLHPDICAPMVVDIAVQRQPETRVHFVKSDGEVAMLTYDPAENIMCWTRVVTEGVIESAAVLPGTGEDQVYYVVKRIIGGVTKRYLEKWAMESEAIGGTINKIADSFVHYSGSATTSITGLSHLEGEEVVVWADGADVGTHTVASGAITLATAAEEVVAGLGYDATYKSVKLAYGAQMGTALGRPKRVNHLGIIFQDTHYQGLEFGRDFDHLDPLPLSRDGAPLPADSILEEYDERAFPFPGDWHPDSRVCLKASAPRPCNVLALVLGMETNG